MMYILPYWYFLTSCTVSFLPIMVSWVEAGMNSQFKDLNPSTTTTTTASPTNLTGMDAPSGDPNGSRPFNISAESIYFPEDKLEMFIVPSIYAIVIVGGCVANIFLIAILYRNRRINRHSTGILMLNLALADLLFLLFWVPFHTIIYTISYWPFGDFMCRFVHYVQFSSMFASIFTLSAMAVERYSAIRFPIWTKFVRNPKTATIISMSIWLTSLCLGVPAAVVYTVFEYEGAFYCADSFGDNHHLRPTFFLVLFLIGYVIPLSTIFILSTLTVCSLWSARGPEDINVGVSVRSKRRATKIVISLVLVFACMWFPYHLNWIWVNYFRSSFTNSYFFYYFQVFAYLFAFTNSALNPLVYAFCSENFRKRLCRCSQPSIETRSITFHSRLAESSERNPTHGPQAMTMHRIAP